MDKAQQDALKKAAGIEAAKLVENGMIAGLGTGSTVKFLVDELGRRHQEEGLEFTGVTTSRRSAAQAESYGIKIVDIDDVDHIDVTIDGADEVDKNFNGIKGGGAALLWEKIVATNSNQIVWIVDESKVVDTIGNSLPVEVIPFGAGQVIKKFEARGYKPVLRLDADGKEKCAPTRTTSWWTCTWSADPSPAGAGRRPHQHGRRGGARPVPQHGRQGHRRRPERPARDDQRQQVIDSLAFKARICTSQVRALLLPEQGKEPEQTEKPRDHNDHGVSNALIAGKTTHAGGGSYAAVCGASSCSSACGAS